MHRTRRSAAASAVAMQAVTEVFPVQPLPDATAISSPTYRLLHNHSCVHYKGISHKKQVQIQHFPKNFHQNNQKMKSGEKLTVQMVELLQKTLPKSVNMAPDGRKPCILSAHGV
jgi:hypothetical protein